MSPSAVLTAALQLAPRERADLAHRLIASLDEDTDAPSGDVEAAWLAEVEEREQRAERGEATFEPWEVVEARIAGRLRALHR